MRLYTFINFYLSQIQQGIQTAHIVHELFNKYKFSSSTAPLQLERWSREHKTIIVLNGGVDQQIGEMMDIFAKYEFPFEQFVEDEGLCKARTGCGVVLPEWIYNAERQFDYVLKTHCYHYVDGDKATVYYPGDKYFDLVEAVKSKRLA